MNKIIASVVSVTAVCLAAVPAFAQSSSGHSPSPSGSIGGSTITGTGAGANGSNFGGTGNTAPLGPRVSPGITATGNPGIGSGGTARFSPGVLAQAQSLQQRLAAARAAAEQGGSEAPLDTIPVAGEPAVPPNVERIRGRG
jgi:hypothetical protein